MTSYMVILGHKRAYAHISSESVDEIPGEVSGKSLYSRRTCNTNKLILDPEILQEVKMAHTQSCMDLLSVSYCEKLGEIYYPTPTSQQSLLEWQFMKPTALFSGM